jgi:glycosyltransferase involved in cell wall biosynthesis
VGVPETSPTAVVVCSHFPFPITSGGRKRTVRLLETMERAGVRPHIVTHDRIIEGHAEARERGWEFDLVPLPVGTVGNRLRQHARSEAAPHSSAMARHLRGLAGRAAFVQLEEIASAQYVHAAPPGVPTVISLYNVDSAVLRDAARLDEHTSGRRSWRALYRAKRMELTERRAVRRADAVLAVSDHDRRQFERWGARNPMLVANGVDPELFDLPEQVAEDERVLFFGQFGWTPNLDGLLRYLDEAWPLVAAQRPRARLRIAGPGSTEAVREAAAGHERVEVLGFVEDLVAELAATRVVVASLWVGGGTRLKVLEALAAARPVVGTPVGVGRIGFEHDRHGLISDTPAGLAEATVRVLDDDGLAARFAVEGRRLAEQYRWETTTAPAKELYGRFRELRQSSAP